jgi:sugar phosphate isomerase/epimerase
MRLRDRAPCDSDGALLGAHYRIGTTSFVHPAGWLENATRLAGRVDDVELLLFEDPVPGHGPAPDEIAALARLGRESRLTWSVHAPLGIALASEDGARRQAGIDAVRRAIDVTAPLAPHAVVVHLAPGEREGAPPPEDWAAFARRAIGSIREVLGTGLPAAALCLETLEYDFALAEPVVEELGLSVALDVGHLARDGAPLEPVLRRNLARARVVQWHGTDGTGRDHRSIRHYPRAEALHLLRTLREARWDGVLTLEVFREADLEDSLGILRELEREAA